MKTFLIDTNVLLSDPNCLKVFDDNEVIIPLSVLDELDGMKLRPDELGRNARYVIRMLDSLRAEGSLSEGVRLGNSIIKVETNHCGKLPPSLLSDKIDNRILSTAIGLAEEKHVIVVSKDINLRVKCDVLGIQAQDYVKDKLAEDLGSIYSGAQVKEVPSSIIDDLYSEGNIQMDFEAYPNQFVVLTSEENSQQSAIARHVQSDVFVPIRQVKKGLFNIKPRNAEQRMAVDLLLDPDIKIVTLLGRAGSGKTLLACAAALHHVLNDQKHFAKALISRPIQPMGRDLGYLPGTLDEKLQPWMQPLYDNLELLLGSEYQSLGSYDGLIQVEPLTYIRGRSIPKSFMILDEAQNLNSAEIKTIITRMGDHSKIVITGDIEQIDCPYVDFADNGLTHVVEKFKDYAIAGHVTLRKGERSELATLASEIL